MNDNNMNSNSNSNNTKELNDKCIQILLNSYRRILSLVEKSNLPKKYIGLFEVETGDFEICFKDFSRNNRLANIEEQDLEKRYDLVLKYQGACIWTTYSLEHDLDLMATDKVVDIIDHMCKVLVSDVINVTSRYKRFIKIKGYLESNLVSFNFCLPVKMLETGKVIERDGLSFYFEPRYEYVQGTVSIIINYVTELELKGKRLSIEQIVCPILLDEDELNLAFEMFCILGEMSKSVFEEITELMIDMLIEQRERVTANLMILEMLKKGIKNNELGL